MQFCTFLFLDGDPLEKSPPESLDVLSLVGESSPAIVTLVLCILYSALPSRRQLTTKKGIAFRLLSTVVVLAIGVLFFSIVQILSCEEVMDIGLEWAALPVGVLFLVYGFLIWRASSTRPQLCVVASLVSASAFCVLNWVGREIVETRAVTYAVPAQTLFCAVAVLFLPHHVPNARSTGSAISFVDPFSKRDRCGPLTPSVCWVDRGEAPRREAPRREAPRREATLPPKSELVL